MIVTGEKSQFLTRAIQRGYSIDEVMPCVVSQDGDQWSVDTEHPSYPRVAKNAAPLPVETGGAGTELKRLLSGWPFYINATPSCPCNARARIMDERGVEWCESNIQEIVGWLREEASNRKLPFVDAAGILLVKRAIRNAKRKSLA